MMILDSDVIIYSGLPESQHLRDFIRSNASSYSVISMVEVLGYHRLSEYDRRYFGKFFDSLTAFPVSDEIIFESIRLRQQHKINLGDSLIAATAIGHNLPLVTNNSKDFKWIDALNLIDPFAIQ